MSRSISIAWPIPPGDAHRLDPERAVERAMPLISVVMPATASR
jgi:hypothetical protein